MRTLSLASLASMILLSLPVAGVAQTRGPVTIDKVVVGYPSDLLKAQFKSGAWTPVYIDLTAGPSGLPKADLVVETDDSDDVRSRYTVQIPPLDPKEQTTVLAYIRPGSSSADVGVTVRVSERPVATFKEVYGALPLDEQLLLAIGSRLNSLRMALSPTPATNVEDENAVLKEEGPRHSAVIDDVRMLPKDWFAYESVDVVILATGNRDFVTALLSERERKEALAEWVRRGGKLIVSLGRNQDMIANLEPIQTMLPVAVTGTLQLPQLYVVEKWVGPPQRPFENPRPRGNPGGARPPVEIAKLERKAGREIDVVLPQQHQDGPLLLVHGSYGLGRVTVLAFDLDAPPFSTWVASAQRDFWTKLVEGTASPLPSHVGDSRRQMGGMGMEAQQIDVATQLESNLEDFEDVPVISFGWVALFILVYILVVGPLDYFFLKKVVKRLELTWITFPTVVITISVVAYFTAYWLKGNDQKINKVDLVDIDVPTQQIYGNTWFTIFSPRIQHYTVGLEPASPQWAPPAVAGKQETSVTMTWMVRPENTFMGAGRTHSQGLFRRAYDYTADATAMIGVPIQVWSTKSFSASWQAPLDPTKPLVSADLRHPKDKAELISGTITSRLPADLEDVWIYHAVGGTARWYHVDRLVPDSPQRVDNLLVNNANARDMKTWLTVPDPAGATRAKAPASSRGAVAEATSALVKKIMFHQAAGDPRRDTPLRSLDQSWRLHHKDEVVVVGRLARRDGLAEVVTKDAASPSRLWLGSVPEVGQPRPEMFGTMSQETYVRMIIPVRTDAK
jgi:hypothetical protein